LLIWRGAQRTDCDLLFLKILFEEERVRHGIGQHLEDLFDIA
jgi:hypothetical protein